MNGMKFFTVELLLSETYKEFEQMFDLTEALDSNVVYDEELGEWVDREEEVDLSPYITKMWTMASLEKDKLTQTVMIQQLENNGWYDPYNF